MKGERKRKKKGLFGTGEGEIGVGVREQWAAVSKSKAPAVQPLSQNPILPSTQLAWPVSWKVTAGADADL